MIKNGKIWPIMIAVATFAVVLLGYWTIKETLSSDLSESTVYMDKYQNVDENINEIIVAQMQFNKNYTITYEEIDVFGKTGKVVFKITTKDGKPVNDASIELVLQRPVNDAKEVKLLKPTSIKDGIYTFENITMPKEGRWDIYTKVTIGKYTRYYNLRFDKRLKKFVEM